MKPIDQIMVGGLRFRPIDQISSNYINSPDDMEKLERYIETQLKEYRLDTLLLEIHKHTLNNSFPDYPVFAFVALTKEVLLNCTMYGKLTSMPDEEFLEFIRILVELETYDPKFSNELKSNRKKAIASFLLRTIGKQVQWDRNIRYMLSRTLYLFEELIDHDSASEYIKDIVNSKFKKQFGVSLRDFIKIGAILFAGSSNQKRGLRRDYLEKARNLGMPVPDDDTVRACLNLIACSPNQFKNDKLFIKYNLNPLLRYPIIRIWDNSDSDDPYDDKFIAPIPNLLMYRITIGLYYQLYNLFGEDFSREFGDLFELYVSKILDGFKLSSRVLSEDEVDIYIKSKGKKGWKPKRPDWTIFTEEGIILIECKTTHYTNDMYERGINAKSMACFKQIRKSLVQFDNFEHQLPELCKKLGESLEDMKILRVIVSFEPLWGLNDGPLKEYIDGRISRDWVIIPVEILEEIQPYIAKGANLWSFISEFKLTPYHDFNKIIDRMESETGAKDSENMFREYRNKLFDELLRDVDDR